MKKSTKILLISAGCLALLGIILFSAGIFAGAEPVKILSSGPSCGLTPGERQNEYSPENRYSLSPAGLEELSIDWADGRVELEYHSGSDIIIEESAEKELSSDTALDYVLKDGELKIRFMRPEPGSEPSGLSLPEKNLRLLLPQGFMPEELSINTVGADVFLRSIKAGELEAVSVNGDVQLSSCSLSSLSFSSADGSLSSVDCLIEETEAETVSGDLRLSLSRCPEELSFQSVSGDAELSLPGEGSFCLSYNTVSGELSSDFELSRQGKQLCSGSGGALLEINTVSGDISILKN